MRGDQKMRFLGRSGAAVAAAAGVGALVMALSSTTALAGGNPHFENILAAKTPTGFLVSPQAYDVSQGPVSVNFDVSVRNLTDSTQTVKLNFSVDHILTYNGQDVSDGQPGQPGITFHGPQGTTQKALPGTQAFTATWEAGATQELQRTWSLDQCGYFQVDIWAPIHSDSERHRATLASGFIRALGCGGGSTQSPTPTPTPTSSPSGGGGGGVLGITTSTPSTGASPGAGTLGAAGLLLIIGAGLLFTGRRRRTDI